MAGMDAAVVEDGEKRNMPHVMFNTDSVILQDQEEEEPSARRLSLVDSHTGVNYFSILLLAFYIYADASVALWQNVYKDYQVESDGPDCSVVHDWIKDNQHGFEVIDADGVPHTEPLRASPACPFSVREPVQPIEDSERAPAAINLTNLVSVRRLGAAEPDGVEVKSSRQCSWKAAVHKATGKLSCKAQSFTKGCALSFQAMCGIVVFYSYNYYVGGWQQLSACWDMTRLLKFSGVGAMFGAGAVFSFLAQDALSPGSYALYAQTGVVAVPILWRIVFKKPLPILTWIHISIIAFGIIMYRISEVELDKMFDGIGMLWVGLKVLCAGFGSVLAEMLLKEDSHLPFTVQVSCILPSKAITCLLTVWLLPGEKGWPNSLPDRPGGFFHDWNFLTLIIVFHNLGDTVMSAIVAKQFDSVVKAICGVVGIIFPTWFVSYVVGWEELDLSLPQGQLKLAGGIVVILGSFSYVLGRSQNAKLARLEDQAKRNPPALDDLELSDSVSRANTAPRLTMRRIA